MPRQLVAALALSDWHRGTASERTRRCHRCAGLCRSLRPPAPTECITTATNGRGGCECARGFELTRAGCAKPAVECGRNEVANERGGCDCAPGFELTRAGGSAQHLWYRWMASGKVQRSWGLSWSMVHPFRESAQHLWDRCWALRIKVESFLGGCCCYGRWAHEARER